MYYQYWNLHKPPFDNVPDPSMYADCHVSMENAIAETLFAIEEGNECLAVIIGDVGLGKTLSLRIIIDSLDPERYLIALVTNPSLSFVQLMNEILGQLTGKQWNEKKKVNLLEAFNQLIFRTAEEGKKIVLLIDEANVLTPTNLENLRLLTNMQDDRKNLFTIVLAGQIELARRLEDPKRANLFQRIGTYSWIEKIPSLEALRTYVETRLRLAGAVEPIFTEDTYPLFWKFSEEGVPRLINKIAKLSLKAGETYGLRRIDGRIVAQVGKQFEKTALPARGKGKKKKEDVPSLQEETPPVLTQELSSKEELSEGIPAAEFPKPPEEEVFTTPAPESFSPPEPAPWEEAPKEEAPPSLEQTAPFTEASGHTSTPPSVEGQEEIKGEGEPSPGFLAENPPEISEERIPPFSSPTETAGAGPVVEGIYEEFQIEKYKVRVHLPPHFLQKALASSEEERLKMAGQAAVQAIKKFVEMTSIPLSDPVNIWSQLRAQIIKRLEADAARMAA